VTGGDLGAFLRKDEAQRLADEVRMSGGVGKKVLDSVDATRRSEAERLLRATLEQLSGSAPALAVVLDALGGVPQGSPPSLVWTSPAMAGAEGDTTLAVSSLINEARRYVYAATFSGGSASMYVKALQHVIRDQGVKVTLVVDRAKQRETAADLAAALPGARLWTLPANDEKYPPFQHAKIVMVDGLAALITSANYSKAAAERHLECGVLLRDAAVAQRIKAHLDLMRQHGHLVDY
jgi:phosphatidylserine/phosphatidylglycerophosphate/cardiolipin synthase-like enzyme